MKNSKSVRMQPGGVTVYLFQATLSLAQIRNVSTLRCTQICAHFALTLASVMYKATNTGSVKAHQLAFISTHARTV
jgi:hypothetical protein